MDFPMELAKLGGALGVVAGIVYIVLKLLDKVLDKQSARFELILQKYGNLQDHVIDKLVGVIEGNTKAMAEIKGAVDEVRRVMSVIEERLNSGDRHFDELDKVVSEFKHRQREDE